MTGGGRLACRRTGEITAPRFTESINKSVHVGGRQTGTEREREREREISLTNLQLGGSGDGQQPQSNIWQLADDEHKDDGDHHSRYVLTLSPPTAAAPPGRRQLRAERAAPRRAAGTSNALMTSFEMAQRLRQTAVEHGQHEQRTDRSKHQVTAGLVHHEVYLVIVQRRLLTHTHTQTDR